MKNFFLLIIPFAILISLYYNNNIRKNYDINMDYDPNYAYLLNSLNIANLQGVFLYQHPGTPTMVFSGMILRITHTLRHTKNNITDDVLTYPRFYLVTIAWVFSDYQLFINPDFGLSDF